MITHKTDITFLTNDIYFTKVKNEVNEIRVNIKQNSQIRKQNLLNSGYEYRIHDVVYLKLKPWLF